MKLGYIITGLFLLFLVGPTVGYYYDVILFSGLEVIITRLAGVAFLLFGSLIIARLYCNMIILVLERLENEM